MDFSKLFESEKISNSEKYSALNIKFNPFPRSGTTNINASDIYFSNLVPIDEKTSQEIADFISHALKVNESNVEDKFISATITGNYGSGKTLILMFIKYLLGNVGQYSNNTKNPYVIYIDNPGVKLLEFIGSIIEKIGEEDIKKYIWTMIIDNIKNDPIYRQELKKYQNTGGAFFIESNPDPYHEENTISYRNFLNAFLLGLNTAKVRKDFEQTIRDIIIKILEKDTGDSVIAYYFYELLADDLGINKTWEALSAGNIKQLDKKEASIIKYIVKLLKKQNYTDFVILVDEFEDITEGRLSKPQVDNYIYNLRTLLDEHREWSLLFAMTGQALRKLKSVSPPLADRITNRLIVLQDLNLEQGKAIIRNYLNFARDNKSDSINPFQEAAIAKLIDITKGNARRFLKNCFFIIEKAIEKNVSSIDLEFVVAYGLIERL